MAKGEILPAHLVLPAIAATLCLMTASPGFAAGQDVPLEKQTRRNSTMQFPNSKDSKDLGLSVPGDVNEDQQYREVFKLILRRGEAAVLDLVSSEFDPKLQVLSETGEELAKDDDGGDDGRSSKLVFTPPENKGGTFYVVASSADNREGKFRLNATPRPPPSPATVTEIVAGQEIKGSFGPASAFNLDRQRIYTRHWFEAAPGERISIEARSATVDLDLLVLKDGQEDLKGETGAKGASLYYPAAVAGKHYVEVLARPDSSGDYTLLFKRLPQPGSATTPKPLVLDEPVLGAFAEDTPRMSPISNRPQALFVLSGAAGERFVLSAKVDNTDGAVGYNAPPVTLSAGADTPAGFAEVQKATSAPDTDSAQIAVLFARSGELLVRLAGKSGAISPYTLVARRAAPQSSAAPSNTKSN